MRAWLTTPMRLSLAAVLCLLPLGMTWGANLTPGTLVPVIECQYSPIGDPTEPGATFRILPICNPVFYPVGISGHNLPGWQEPVRVLLVVPVLVFALAAVRRRTAATRRAVQVATAVLAAALAFAVAGRVVPAVVTLALAVALVAPLVFGPGRSRRSSPTPAHAPAVPPSARQPAPPSAGPSAPQPAPQSVRS